jgi:ATP-dependent RNA helicase DeaD
MCSFENLGLNPEIIKAVEQLGFVEPTDIQVNAITPLLEGRDLLGQAQTGTGKTAAFGLPMINKIDSSNKAIQGLVLAPTRELAIQVADALKQYGRYSGIQIATVYGGQSYTIQLRQLKNNNQIVVGTPGRMLDLIKRKALDLSQVKFLVLDEADEMLTMGFIEDVEAIINETPETRQTALFSATLPERIKKLADNYLIAPEEIIIKRKTLTVDKIDQRYYALKNSDKTAALIRLIEFENIQSGLIFTRTKIGSSELADELIQKGFSAEALHGDLKQISREKVLKRFRRKDIRFLVATSVAARGLDIEDVSHVINFDIPEDPEEYVHRIGRTGRAGKTGQAVTFVNSKEQRRLKEIERFTSQPIQKADLPSIQDVLNQRDEQFSARIVELITAQEFNKELNIAQQLVNWGYDPLDISAVLIKIIRKMENHPYLEDVTQVSFSSKSTKERKSRRERDERKPNGRKNSRKKDNDPKIQEAGMVRHSIELGRKQNVRPGMIVGAIANQCDIPGNAIGAIEIHDTMTYLDISEKYAGSVSKKMKNWKVDGKPARLQQA